MTTVLTSNVGRNTSIIRRIWTVECFYTALKMLCVIFRDKASPLPT